MNDYPTKSELGHLRELGEDWGNPQKVIDFLKEIWHWQDYVKVSGKKVIRLELITGGWSGNEEIIATLNNTMFWRLWWEKSERGGCYLFVIRPNLTDSQVKQLGLKPNEEIKSVCLV
jgi:hypothetical protein